MGQGLSLTKISVNSMTGPMVLAMLFRSDEVNVLEATTVTDGMEKTVQKIYTHRLLEVVTELRGKLCHILNFVKNLTLN